MKNYKQLIIRASKETIIQAISRIKITQSRLTKKSNIGSSNIVTVTFDHAANKTRAVHNGRLLFEHDGEDLWNEFILELRRFKRRGELGENPRFILKTEKIKEGKKIGDTQYDITSEVAA